MNSIGKPFNIGPRDYKKVNKAIMHGADTVPSTGVWLSLHQEYNLGILQGNIIILDAKSRIGIAEKVKEITDLDPRTQYYDDIKRLSRTQVSLLTNDEKFISLPPREAFVEVRHLTKNYHPPSYQGLLVNDVISLNCNCFVSVENFDTFANLQLDDLTCLKRIAGANIWLVYTGDNKASPKAVKQLTELNERPWVHFGDYDPAGIHMGLSRIKATHLILPSINVIKSSLELSNALVFNKQYTQLKKLKKCTSAAIVPHVELIEQQGVAIMQEQLIAHKIPLSLVRC